MGTSQLIWFGFMVAGAYVLVFALAGPATRMESRLLVRLVMFAGCAAIGILTRWTADYQGWPPWIQLVVSLLLASPFIWAGIRWEPPEE